MAITAQFSREFEVFELNDKFQSKNEMEQGSHYFLLFFLRSIRVELGSCFIK